MNISDQFQQYVIISEVNNRANTDQRDAYSNVLVPRK